MNKHVDKIMVTLVAATFVFTLSSCMLTRHQFSREFSGEDPSRASVLGSLAVDIVTAPIQAPIVAGQRIAEDARDPTPPAHWKKRETYNPYLSKP